MEIFDLYDCARRPVGQTMVRGDQTPPGLYRLVVHVCIFNSKGELLIQQRQSFKDGWPNLWDVSVGGSVITGESSQMGAHRELLEELSLDVDFSALAPALTTTFTGGFDDCYVLHMDLDPAELKLQYEEVQAARWASKTEVLALLACGQFIPYQQALLEYLFFRSAHCGNLDAT